MPRFAEVTARLQSHDTPDQPTCLHFIIVESFDKVCGALCRNKEELVKLVKLAKHVR